MRSEGLASQQRSVFRFGGDNLDLGARQLEHFAHAGDGAAGTPAADKIVEPPTGEVAKDLRGSGVAVIGRVGRVLELPGQIPAVLGSQFFGLAHHARTALGGRRQDDLGAEHAHDAPTLDREGFDHHGDKGIALGSADHCQRNAGVAGRGFNDGLTWLERATALRIFNDGDSQPVFDRGGGVEELALHIDRDAGGCQTLQLDDRCAADSAQNAVVDHGELPVWWGGGLYRVAVTGDRWLRRQTSVDNNLL